MMATMTGGLLHMYAVISLGGLAAGSPPSCNKEDICDGSNLGGSYGPRGPLGKNVLFLASDDMRPEISPYGAKYMHTPNMQALADDGFVFRRMFVQQALCAPSRTVLLTGRRPDTSHVWTIGPYFRDTVGKDWVTLPQWFKEHGYVTAGAGKLFHHGGPSGYLENRSTSPPTVVRSGDDYPASWTIPYTQNLDLGVARAQYPVPGQTPKYNGSTGWSNRGIEGPLENFNDYRNAMAMRNMIQLLSNTTMDAPFFIAQGFHRPHIPYIFPKQFEQYYPNDTIKYGPEQPGWGITKDVPVMAPHDWTSEGMRYGDLHDVSSIDAKHARTVTGNVPCEGSDPENRHCSREFDWNTMCDAMPYWKGQEMKRSYYSCISYVDYMIGELVAELKTVQLYEHTTVVFWTDHGYKLGEHCDWFKHDNYEDSTRIVTIIKPAEGLIPNMRARGQFVEQMVEEVDIFPSLIAMHWGPDAVPAELEGESFLPLLQSGNEQSLGKPRVFSQYPHGLVEGAALPAHGHANASGSVMGYTMRTHLYRYTEWAHFNCGEFLNSPMACKEPSTPQWSMVYGVELYNHTGDPSTAPESFGTYQWHLLLPLPTECSVWYPTGMPYATFSSADRDFRLIDRHETLKAVIVVFVHRLIFCSSSVDAWGNYCVGAYENENLAYLSENEALVKSLSAELHQYWPKTPAA